MKRILNWSSIIIISGLISGCGFHLAAQSMHYPFKQLTITSSNAAWNTLLSRRLSTSGVTIQARSPLTLACSKLLYSNSNSSLVSSSTAQIVTYSLSISATLQHNNRTVAKKVFSASLNQYMNSTQLLAPIISFTTKHQLQENILQQISYWLDSAVIKRTIEKYHAN